MSQTASGYERKANDAYFTPAWVTQALLGKFHPHNLVWEPACGDGGIAQPLMDAGFHVIMSDILPGGDFLMDFIKDDLPNLDFAGPMTIYTNPPFGSRGTQAVCFIQRALEITKESAGSVAMLLPVDFDSAKTRRNLFSKHPAFCTKFILTQRIRWSNLPQTSSPTMNHALYVWDWAHSGRPTLEYLP